MFVVKYLLAINNSSNFVTMNLNENKVSERIRELRKTKGLTQVELAAKVGISQPTLTNIEKGQTDNIPLIVCKKLSETLGVSFNELFDVDNPVNTEEKDKLKKEIEVLKENVAHYADRISSLHKWLADKDQIIENLKEQREIYKQSLLISVDLQYNPEIENYKKLIAECSDVEEKSKLENKLMYLEKKKNSVIDNFIYIGFLSKNDIDRFYEELKAHYSR